MTLTAPAHSRASKTCNRCKCALREPARYCGMCESDTLEATILALTAEQPARTLAIWKLRDRGLTARQVTLIHREVKRGVRPYEVVKAIEGLSNWRGA